MRKNQTPKFFNTERDLCGFFKLTKLAPEKNWASETCGEKKPTWRNLRRKKLELRKDAGNSNPKTFLYRAGSLRIFHTTRTCQEIFPGKRNLLGKKPSRTNLPGKKTALSKLAGKKTRANKTSGKIFPSWTPARHPKFSMLDAGAGLDARAGFEKLVATAGF